MQLADPMPYAFAGEAFDSTTNLAYHRARWMDSRVGRFTGMDPWEGDENDPRTLHKYAYGENEPSELLDSTGWDAMDSTGGDDFGASLSGVSLTSASVGAAGLAPPILTATNAPADSPSSSQTQVTFNLYLNVAGPNKTAFRIDQLFSGWTQAGGVRCATNGWVQDDGGNHLTQTSGVRGACDNPLDTEVRWWWDGYNFSAGGAAKWNSPYQATYFDAPGWTGNAGQAYGYPVITNEEFVNRVFTDGNIPLVGKYFTIKSIKKGPSTAATHTFRSYDATPSQLSESPGP